MQINPTWTRAPLVRIEYAGGTPETGAAQIGVSKGQFATVSTGAKASFDDIVTPGANRFKNLGSSLEDALDGAAALAKSHTTANGSILDVAVAVLRRTDGDYVGTPVGHTTIERTRQPYDGRPDIGSAFGLGQGAVEKVATSATPFWLGMDADADGHARTGVTFLNNAVVALVGADSVVRNPAA